MTHSRVEDNHVEIKATQKIRNIQKLKKKKKRKKERKGVHLEELGSTLSMYDQLLD